MTVGHRGAARPHAAGRRCRRLCYTERRTSKLPDAGVGTTMDIEAPPDDWRTLQTMTARILRECGLDAQVEAPVELVRGSANVDVRAEDATASPPSLILCECKHWLTASVPKREVHAFRTVVADSGANMGFLIASGEFQEGALAAAERTNVRLVTWSAFQEIFKRRWFAAHFAPRLSEAGGYSASFARPVLILPPWPEELDADWSEALARDRPVGELVRELHRLQRDGTNRDDFMDSFLAALRAAKPELPVFVQEATTLRATLDALVEWCAAALATYDDLYRRMGYKSWR